MRRTLKYRLYRSKHNRLLTTRIEYASEIWNHFVALSRRYYGLYGKYPGYYKLKRHLTKLKKQRRFEHWNEVGSQAAQMVIKRLDLSYQAYFDYKTGKRSRVGLPGFKKRSMYSSFTLTQAGWKYEGSNRVRIGKHTFKFVLSRPVSGAIKTVTIKRDRCGALWLCLSVQEEDSAADASGYRSPHEEVTHPVGMDFGLKIFLTLSDGSQIESPEFFHEGQKEISRLNRAMSRKRGVVLGQVERSYPSSKRCSRCGEINQKLTLSDRRWRCACGVAHDRDHNASVNIRDRAWSLFRGTVRPSIAAARAA